MKKNSKITEYGTICSEFPLGRLQVGNTEVAESFTSGPPRVLIDIKKVSGESLKHNIKPLFATPKTGYFLHNGTLYYRNCNLVSSTKGGEAYYKGKLPWSYLRVLLEKREGAFVATVETTRTYIFESGSRFTENQSFQKFVNNLFIVLSILDGKIPMHAAGIKAPQGAVLFMGYPNTGKTTTSADLFGQSRDADYMFEDICFVDTDDLTVFSCPYTPQKKEGALLSYKPLKSIVGLKRQSSGSELWKAGPEECFKFIHTMNLYEFNWDQNMLIKHLLTGESAYNQSDVACAYVKGLELLSKKADFFVLSGADPKRYANDLKEAFKKEYGK